MYSLIVIFCRYFNMSALTLAGVKIREYQGRHIEIKAKNDN